MKIRYHKFLHNHPLTWFRKDGRKVELRWWRRWRWPLFELIFWTPLPRRGKKA